MHQAEGVTIDFDAIPSALKDLPQWVTWQQVILADGKTTKQPVNAKTGRLASTTRPASWSTFDRARAAYEADECAMGVGFVFAAADPFVGGDLDHMRDPATGVLNERARALVDQFATYAEVSPSGCGVHVIGIGRLPGKGKHPEGIGLFDRERYFTMTGRRIVEAPAEPRDVSTPLAALYAEMEANRPADALPRSPGHPSIDDDAVLAAAFASKSGAAIRALWDGDTSAHAHNHSNADQSLTNHLAFYTANDAAQMDRLFRASRLMRSKWDQRSGSVTYGERTIAEAIRITGETYSAPTPPPIVKSSANGHVKPTQEFVATEEDEPDADDPQESKAKRDLADAGKLWAKLYSDEWAWDSGAHTWRRWVGTHHQEEPKGSIPLDLQAMHVLKLSGLAVSSEGRMNGVIRAAAAHSPREFVPTHGYVNFQNGTLDTATGSLLAHDNAMDLTYCLPFAHNRQPWPHIEAFLAATIPDDYGRLAYMTHIGLALCGDTRTHKFIILIGPGRSGKSTCLALANAACGHRPAGNAGPDLFSRELEGMRSRATWSSRRLVTLEELPVEALRNEEAIKAMSAHGGVSMRHLFQRESTDNPWLPKLLMATNERPRYSDRSGALTKRLVPVRCPNVRSEDPGAPVETRINTYLLDSLLGELPGFAAACIDRALAALSLGTGAYPMSADMRQLRTEIEQQGDSLKAWIRDECELIAEAFATTDSLYSDYKSYCERGGNKPLAKERFSIAIGERHPEVKPSRHRFGGDSQRSLDGIRLRLDPIATATGDVDEF